MNYCTDFLISNKCWEELKEAKNLYLSTQLRYFCTVNGGCLFHWKHCHGRGFTTEFSQAGRLHNALACIQDLPEKAWSYPNILLWLQGWAFLTSTYLLQLGESEKKIDQEFFSFNKINLLFFTFKWFFLKYTHTHKPAARRQAKRQEGMCFT